MRNDRGRNRPTTCRCWPETTAGRDDRATWGKKGRTCRKDCPASPQSTRTTGRERAPVYKTLVLTGLRLNELASITMGHCRLDGPTPQLELAAADSKNRQGAMIPLRSELAAELAQWIEDKAEGPREALCDAPAVQF